MSKRVASWVVLLSVAVTLAPRTANALSVTITYTLAPSGSVNHLSTFLGGAAIAGMTAQVRAQLPTLNATTFTGGATLVAFQATGTNLSTFLAPPSLTLTPFVATAVRYVNSNFATDPRITYLYWKLTWFVAALRAQTIRFGAYQYGCTAGCSSVGSAFAVVRGAEVSRVPEPASGSLLLLGLAGIAAVSGTRRFLRRR